MRCAAPSEGATIASSLVRTSARAPWPASLLAARTKFRRSAPSSATLKSAKQCPAASWSHPNPGQKRPGEQILNKTAARELARASVSATRPRMLIRDGAHLMRAGEAHLASARFAVVPPSSVPRSAPARDFAQHRRFAGASPASRRLAASTASDTPLRICACRSAAEVLPQRGMLVPR